MKLNKILLLTTLLVSYGLFIASSCDVCQGLALADLTMDTFESELTQIGEDGDFVYSVSAKVLNILAIANDCSQEELNATAGPSGFLEQVVFSANGSFNDAIVANETIIEILSLDPDEVAAVSDEFELLRDGSYSFFTTVDFRDQVLERNEANNGMEFTAKSALKVIKIQGSGNRELYDEDGNPIYIRKTKKPTVTYEK